jgi:plasmid stabilization system protein ParE
MSRYRITPAARDDLKRISHYIATEKQSPQGDKRLRTRFLESFRRLARNPYLGQACPEFGEHVRIWPVGNYVVLYQPQKDGIDIVQVAHGAQDLPVIVRKPPGAT